MRCPSCDHDNRDAAKFCAECSAPLVRRCGSCGAPWRPNAKFCDECGAAGTSAPTVSAPARDRRAEIPMHLADKILTARRALEGERKQVTVLFADVKGSLELAEQMDPEEWSRIMQRFFTILAEGVERFEGFVDKFTGDGIMALFGAPIAHEDHARRACYAAVHLLDALRGYANDLRLRHGLNFSVRLGLNSGEVIVGKIGDDLRMDYTAQGHTVGLAARMEQIAEPGKVYLTAHTAAEVQGYFALADLGAMEIKGVQGALHVYELQGLGPMRTRLDVSRSRGFSRFVGRGDEMQVLESALVRAREGHTQVVGVVGEAGLGKSRLCYEFLERCRARGLMTYETTGVAHGKAIPLLPILRLFRAFYGITEQDSDATARERIAGRLLLLDERLRESLPLNFEFMGVPDPENPAPRIDPEARQRQMFDIVRRVVQARGQRETTVTLLEDLHWFDDGSAAFLEPMIDAVVGTRALVLVNFRPEYQAPWMGKSYYHQMPLAPLGSDAIREMLEALLGNDPSTAGLAEAIHTRTAGNPFFTEEVVQNLIESGKLEGIKGAYRLVTPVDKLEVPSSVRALLAARIDRLAQRDKDVLQTAAVIGREFDEPTLAAVVEQDAPQLREALQTLKDAEFVYEQSLYPVAEYLFKHPLTQEVALASQLQERRRRLHAAVARVIEAAHDSDLDRQAALLAHHWDEADDPAQAARWHRRAAEWIAGSNSAEARRHWNRVRELAERIDDPTLAQDLGQQSRLMILEYGWRLGVSADEANELLREGEAWAQRHNDPHGLAALYNAFVIPCAFILGDLRRAHELAAAGLQLAEQAGDSALACALDLRVYFVAESTGVVPAMFTAMDAILRHDAGDMERASPLVGYDVPALVAGWSWSRLWAGQMDAAHDHLRRGIDLARARNAVEVTGWLLSQQSDLWYERGDATRASGTASESLEIAERIESPLSQGIALRAFGRSLVIGGDAHAAVSALERALSFAARILLQLESEFLSDLAVAQCVVGALAVAQAAAERALELAVQRGTLRGEVCALRALAGVHLARGSDAAVAEARRLLDRAESRAEEIGQRIFLPHLYELRARAAERARDTVAAQAALRKAQQLFREMGAPLHVERLAKELPS